MVTLFGVEVTDKMKLFRCDHCIMLSRRVLILKFFHSDSRMKKGNPT